MNRKPSRQDDTRTNAHDDGAQRSATRMLTVHDLREALVKKIIGIIDRMQQDECPRLACRRRHDCVPPRGQECQSPSRRKRDREMTPDEEAAFKARFMRAVKRRKAELEARGEYPDADDDGAALLSAPRDRTPSGLPSRRRGARS